MTIRPDTLSVCYQPLPSMRCKHFHNDMCLFGYLRDYGYTKHIRMLTEKAIAAYNRKR